MSKEMTKEQEKYAGLFCNECGKKRKFRKVLVEYSRQTGEPYYLYEAICTNWLCRLLVSRVETYNVYGRNSNDVIKRR